MQETWVRSLGLEDPLEKELATHSSILAGIIAWSEEPGGLQSLKQLDELIPLNSLEQNFYPFLRTVIIKSHKLDV